MLIQTELIIKTSGRGLINITRQLEAFVTNASVTPGLLHVFLNHTSASLIICENADPLVLKDLQAFMSRLVPDSDDLYQHIAEGIDDMPAHIRTILTQSFLLLPITEKKLAIGRWQGIYLWEHRLSAHHRRLTLTVL